MTDYDRAAMAADAEDWRVDDTKPCAGCGNAGSITEQHVKACGCCEAARAVNSLQRPEFWCADCSTVCPSCNETTCEFHMGKSECEGCSGPSDGGNANGQGYSSDAMSSVRDIGR